MAASPSSTIVVDGSTGKQMNLLQFIPQKGFDAQVIVAPQVDNLGYGGKLTGGSPLYYPSGGGQKATINWVNSSGEIVDRWQFADTAARDAAIAEINTEVTAGTPVITV